MSDSSDSMPTFETLRQENETLRKENEVLRKENKNLKSLTELLDQLTAPTVHAPNQKPLFKMFELTAEQESLSKLLKLGQMPLDEKVLVEWCGRKSDLGPSIPSFYSRGNSDAAMSSG